MTYSDKKNKTAEYNLYKEVMLIYKFYLDVFILQNFFMNGAIILFTMWSMKLTILQRLKNIILWDVLGTFFSVVMLVMPIEYHLYQIISFLIIIPLMCKGASGLHNKNDLFKLILYSYIIAFLLGGISQAINNSFGNIYIFAVAVCFASIYIWNSCKKEAARLYICQLTYTNPKDGIRRSSKVTGLYDTGNVLKASDNKIISIVSEHVIKSLKMSQRPMIVKYCTVSGNETMEVYQIDRLIIFQNGKEINIDSAYIGKINDQILKDKKYQMILNGGVFDENVYDHEEICKKALSADSPTK